MKNSPVLNEQISVNGSIEPVVSETTDASVAKDPTYWRSLAELADSPEYRNWRDREFAPDLTDRESGVSRREFMTLMGAAMALAGLASCRRPVEKIIPYVIKPEEITPGISQHYATTMPLGLSACGLMVESHEGRPTKIEGNPAHSASRGAVSAQVMASILGLYDPDRSQSFLKSDASVPGGAADFVAAWQSIHAAHVADKGAGLAVVCESFNSPTLSRLHKQFMSAFPQARWVAYEPISDESVYAGIKIASGQDVIPVCHFERAKIIVSLDSDFLLHETDSVRNAQDFATGRRVENVDDDMSRLYVVESGFTITGGMADHRLVMKSSDIAAFAVALAVELGKEGIVVAGAAGVSTPGNFDTKWLGAVAKDLAANRGQSLVVAGARQGAAVHALVASINQSLGNSGATVTYHALPDATLPSIAGLRDVVVSLQSGAISTLVILGGNPVYNSPADIDFASAMAKAKNTVHLGLHVDETSAKCQWHIPSAHYLEAWGDARSLDGSVGVIQPLIAPLYGGWSMVEVVGLLASGKQTPGYELVRESWRGTLGGDFEKSWRKVVHDGVAITAAPVSQSLTLNDGAIASAIGEAVKGAGSNDLEICFAPSMVFDGRYSNNAWLQETPDPVTKVTWDNAALIGTGLAKELGVATNDLVTVTSGGASIELPILVQPGQGDRSVLVALGYGRQAAGAIGNGVGHDSYRLRTVAGWGFVGGVTLAKTNRTYQLSITQDHGSMVGRPIIREGRLDEYRKNPKFAQEMAETPNLQSLWTEHTYDSGNQWGMTIDLNSCTGCNACVVACQSENNIPVVGKEQVGRGRIMHWLRLDRYYKGDSSDPSTLEMVHQPMACQHCEMAPCEQVCPVAATVHDSEGLNVMVYNRCIGTKYCSNNCPYKVRKFNYFNYTKDTPEVVKMAMNPDVTVRFRGVMEKCTYCVQRIGKARTTAKLAEKDMQDGDVVTACQQACPSKAISFGNIRDKNSAVAKAKKQDRNYDVLADINTRPRTSYLAKLRNPNPSLVITAGA